MKILFVRQPWASLLVSGLKDIENRTWAPNFKGRILIHASSTRVPKRC
ncbi:ASCH domain-containing protein, partial [Hoylesella shahii]